MSTTAVSTAPAGVRRTKPPIRPVPMGRILATELRKMFDTRSGFWLMASIGITALIATGATIIFAPDSALTFETFATAVGFPIAVILPMVSVLSVTGEWSQRTGLTTFTLIPDRRRVIAAKFVLSIAVGAASMFVALAIGAVGNLVGTAITGTETIWNVSVTEFAFIVLANVLGMLIGFMLGVLIRNSAGAIVGYFVFNFMLPTLMMTLANLQDWFRDIWGWVDFSYAQSALFEGSLTGEEWAQLGVTTLIWMVLPTLIGLRLLMRSEVK
ncbi:ABC transporter permease [Nocardioides sp. Bht2]|uniref:ABC transporter permease n=1 Tax=Nocardioides sp. Bht2 TaxID=3392297 RepID=UPI0039B62FF6